MNGISFNYSSNPRRWVSWTSFYRWGNWGTIWRCLWREPNTLELRAPFRLLKLQSPSYTVKHLWAPPLCPSCPCLPLPSAAHSSLKTTLIGEETEAPENPQRAYFAFIISNTRKDALWVFDFRATRNVFPKSLIECCSSPFSWETCWPRK